MQTEVWRLLPFHRGSSADHVALSDALVRRAVEPTVWWHAAETSTLILGAGQSAIEAREISTVRRHAGGTAVLADPRVLGLDVFLPRLHPLAACDLIDAYRWQGELWVQTLGCLGIGTRSVSIGEARAAISADVAPAVRAACFGTLSPFEVVAGGRKLVGFAQVRRLNGVLLQAGIHLTFDPRGLAQLLDADNVDWLAAELQQRAVGLDELRQPMISGQELRAALERALESTGKIRLTPGNWRERELTHAGLESKLLG